jgi:putative ABC transport system ATP-binding protein
MAVSFALRDGVCYGYRPNEPVLQDLTFTIKDGEKLAILGRSGVGKTTLLNLLALLWDQKLQKGSILYTSPRSRRDWDYAQMHPREQSQLRGQEFGFVPQSAHVLAGFTCAQNLFMPLALQGTTWAEGWKKINEILDRVEEISPAGVGRDLRGKLNSYPGEISTGQQQRLSALRALIHDPAVLFADEPVSNLDAENRDALLRLFADWHQGTFHRQGQNGSPRSLILICHEAETAWAAADRFLFLRSEKASGAWAELCDKKDFAREHGIDLGPHAIHQGAEALRAHLRQIECRAGSCLSAVGRIFNPSSSDRTD